MCIYTYYTCTTHSHADRQLLPHLHTTTPPTTSSAKGSVQQHSRKHHQQQHVRLCVDLRWLPSTAFVGDAAVVSATDSPANTQQGGEYEQTHRRPTPKPYNMDDNNTADDKNDNNNNDHDDFGVNYSNNNNNNNTKDDSHNHIHNNNNNSNKNNNTKDTNKSNKSNNNKNIVQVGPPPLLCGASIEVAVPVLPATLHTYAHGGYVDLHVDFFSFLF